MLKPILLVSIIVLQVSSFSIPGVSLATYKNNTVVSVDANELDSILTQINFDYYFLNYCPPPDKVKRKKNDNIGAIILGESTEETSYQFKINENKSCISSCSVNLTDKEFEDFKWMIERNYMVNLILDNLPVIEYSFDNFTDGEVFKQIGFPVGIQSEKDFYIFNHLSFRVGLFFVEEKQEYRITEFHVTPKSVGGIRDKEGRKGFCDFKSTRPTDREAKQKLTKDQEIFYSYDVIFFPSDNKHATRWDQHTMLSKADESIHWYSIMNSFVINLILTTVIGYILKRTVGKEIQSYNELKTVEEIQEDRGWKQLSRDIFRPPKNAVLLSTFLGSGIQIGSMIILILSFLTLGFFQKAQRGNLVTYALIFYTLMSSFAGYFSARIYKMFNGAHWIKCTLLTATLYPGVNFLIFYLINIMLIFEESSNALNTLTVITLIALWFGVSMPLVFLGSLIGFKKHAIENPCTYNPIPKFIKPQVWYLNSTVLCLLGGLLPFGAVFIELMYIMRSVWTHSFYYLFAFMFAVLLILVVTSALISIVITYLQLCNGNHRIWWHSFFNTGSVGLYIFAYSVLYFSDNLHIVRFSSTFLYFGYMLATSLTFMLFCGTIGFFSSYWFVKTIYSSIRID